MKKIISLLLIVLFASITYSTQALAEDAFPAGRNTLVGDEPNGDGKTLEEANQSGVTFLGAGAAQVKTCTNCQKAGNVLLSSAARRASPGIRQPTGPSGTTGGSSSSNGVDTGN
ncbi:MAG: hypothetical protein V4654_08660 [Bdellovibrionota bacterium]